MDQNRGPRKTHSNIVNWFLIKENKEFSETKIVLSRNDPEIMRYPYAKTNKKLGTELTLFIIINPKWVISLNLIYKSISHLKDKTEGKLYYLVLDEFLIYHQKHGPWIKKKKIIGLY